MLQAWHRGRERVGELEHEVQYERVYAQDQSTAPEARVLAHKERESVLTGMPSKNKNA